MRVPLALAIPVALATALLPAACGGTGTPSSASAPAAGATASASGATPASSAPSASAHTSAPAPASPPGLGRCRAADLQLSFLGGRAATGHGLLGFELRNRGARSCNVYGYPGVLFLDRSGAPLPTVPVHTATDFFGTLPLTPVTVAPGATMSFRLGVTDESTSGAGCATAYTLQVIPPNDTSALRVSIPDGAYECTTVTVSPIRPGTEAYPSP